MKRFFLTACLILCLVSKAFAIDLNPLNIDWTPWHSDPWDKTEKIMLTGFWALHGVDYLQTATFLDSDEFCELNPAIEAVYDEWGQAGLAVYFLAIGGFTSAFADWLPATPRKVLFIPISNPRKAFLFVMDNVKLICIANNVAVGVRIDW